jgi:ferritin-like metal-binding protein YciE
VKLRSLQDLMVAQLKILRGAEEQIAGTLPKFATSASSPDAVAGLEAQVAESRSQQDRLSTIAEGLGRKLSPRTCDPVAGMLEEMRILTNSKKTDPVVLDVALLSAAQRLLRHRINAYRHARHLAEESGNGPVVELLDEALAEQAKADLDLTKRLTAVIDPPKLDAKVADPGGKEARPPRLRRPGEIVDRLLGVELPTKEGHDSYRGG